MSTSQRPSGGRVVISILGYVIALGLIAVGGIVHGSGQTALTVAGIVVLILSVLFVGLQLGMLEWLRHRARPRTGDRHRGSPPAR